eukprot:7134112-Pyramimonas_sp.AAC.1
MGGMRGKANGRTGSVSQSLSLSVSQSASPPISQSSPPPPTAPQALADAAAVKRMDIELHEKTVFHIQNKRRRLGAKAPESPRGGGQARGQEGRRDDILRC